MRPSLRLSLLLLSLVLGGGRLAWPVSYDFTTIEVPDSARIEPYGINTQGQIVGLFESSGFLLSGGTFTTIHVPDSPNITAYGINDRGQIVGDYVDASGGVHAFVATPTQP
jgi:probable HAF family extracellular repeat protein